MDFALAKAFYKMTEANQEEPVAAIGQTDIYGWVKHPKTGVPHVLTQDRVYLQKSGLTHEECEQLAQGFGLVNGLDEDSKQDAMAVYAKALEIYDPTNVREIG